MNNEIQEIRYQVGEAWKGTYNAATTYGNANVVQDPTGLSVYRSLKPGNVGHPLTDTAWWFLIIDLSSIKEESDRIKALNDAIAADEAQRVENENGRVTAEQGRVDAENARVTAEQGRVTAEQQRVSAEQQRASQEQTRISQEQSRVTAEQGRVAAEAQRVQKEQLRENNEAQRVINETNRVAAEAERVAQYAADHQQAVADHDQYVDFLGVFDLSKHNAVGGVLATYADLSAALTALNALDSQYKYGGMSIKFVQSSDNKYHQFMYMGTAVTGTPNPFLDTTNWQGVDTEPTSDSHNLVESGGVYPIIEELGIESIVEVVNNFQIWQELPFLKNEYEIEIVLISDSVTPVNITFYTGTNNHAIQNLGNISSINGVIRKTLTTDAEQIYSYNNSGTGNYSYIVRKIGIKDKIQYLQQGLQQVSDTLQSEINENSSTIIDVSQGTQKDYNYKTLNKQSNFTLYLDKYVMDYHTPPVAVQNNYFKVFKYVLDNNDTFTSLRIRQRKSGEGYHYVMCYDSNDNFLRRYLQPHGEQNAIIEDVINIDLTGVSYILFNVYTKADGSYLNDYVVTAYTPININTDLPISYTKYSISSASDFIDKMVNLMNGVPSTPSYYNRFVFEFGIGTFNIDVSSRNDIPTSGLYVMPYTTIKGQGREQTKLTFLYSGNDDSVMSNMSGLNCPFTCYLEDFSLEVKNIRYAIHSDGAGDLGISLDDTEIIAKNVALYHRDFDEGLSPTYKAPCAWGAGTSNGVIRKFENCYFFSENYTPFGTHDRKTNIRGGIYDFINCDFINKNVNQDFAVSYNGGSLLLTSYGSHQTIFVNLINCRLNNYVSMRVDPASTVLDKEANYYLRSDNEIFVAIATDNDGNRKKKYTTGFCKEVFFENSATMGSPVVLNGINRGEVATNVTPSSIVYGILLHDVDSGEMGTILYSGRFAQNKILGTSFTTGKRIGWNGTTWVEDNDNPIFIVISTGIGKLL